LIPETELEGWWTSLDMNPMDIIAQCADQGTSEQYHSGSRNDLHIERLSSGKFANKALVLTCARFTYNILHVPEPPCGRYIQRT
jgi:hypothetical protein